MSINICSLTGQPLSKPVVSRKTGHLFEKDAIEKHLATFPYCPVTNQPMDVSDLIEIKEPSAKIVKANESTAVFLKKLQDEYDTIVLESHYLRQSLNETKQQIMHCAYQNEAAQRVIGKLLKEKAETEAQIASLKQGAWFHSNWYFQSFTCFYFSTILIMFLTLIHRVQIARRKWLELKQF